MTKRSSVSVAAALLWGALGGIQGMAQGQGTADGLTLRAAAEEALKLNPGIQAQREQITASEMASRQTRAAYYPRIDFEEIFTNGDDPVYVFGSLLRQGDFGPRNFDPALLNNPKPLNNFNHRLAVSQLIYDGGRRERQSDMAKTGVESNRQGLAGVEQQQLLSLVRNYYRVLLADEALKVARESTLSAEADLERVRQQNSVGLAVKSDVMRLEVQAADFRRAVMAAESEASIARQELELDLGREPAGRIALADALMEKALPQVSLEALIRAAAGRPDLKQAELGVKLAEDRVQSARGGYLPQVGFSGSYDLNNGTSTGLGNQYLLAVRMQFNLFDGGAKSSALQQARAEQQAAVQMHRQLEQRVRQQVQGGYERQRLALEQYRVAKSAVEAARESLRIIQDRREAGLATVTDLLSAQVARNQSHLSALQALYSYFVEFAAMQFAAGILTIESPIFSR